MHTLKVAAIVGVIALSLFTLHHLMRISHHSGASLENRKLWAAWKAQYEKTYSSVAEEEHRFAVFVSNNEMIQKWNSEKRETTLALNKFADLTGEEFKAQYASCHSAASEGLMADKYCPSAVDCPSLPQTDLTSVDWLAKGAVTPVKDQGQCGSCWAFSTTGAIEGLYYLNKSLLISFSESQIVDCATDCYGCNGCWPHLAMNYTAANGLEPEKVYPYKAVKGTCKYSSSLALKVNTGYQCIQQKSVEQLKSAVAMQPVSIAVEADQNAWQFYSKGILASGCGASLDHAVLLTGYDTKKGAWSVKNSWGTGWGDKGYIYLSMDTKANQGYGVCGILRCATIPINN